jgi:hypothetical protein
MEVSLPATGFACRSRRRCAPRPGPEQVDWDHGGDFNNTIQDHYGDWLDLGQSKRDWHAASDREKRFV